jgi:hypothetical protein
MAKNMAKRTFALIALLATGWLWSVPLNAQAVNEGGCAALAEAVRNGVFDIAARTGSGGATGPVATLPSDTPAGDGQPQSCGRTAAVASAAFGSALASFNLPVEWNFRGNYRGPMLPGPFCLLPDLAQCFPRFPPDAVLSAQGRSFVADAWQGVAAGIRRQMPFGTASDISYFRSPELATTLAISLSATVEGGRWHGDDVRPVPRHRE